VPPVVAAPLIRLPSCDKTMPVMVGSVPKTRYAKTLDGGYIAYKILGGGDVDVAIVGSIATNIELFMDFEPAARSWFDLASSARVTLHDRRGTGLSDDMGGLPNLETRAADLLAVLDAAGQERPFLLAAGDGGMVGALLAATRPNRVAGLVWFQAAARSVAGDGWPHGRDPRDVKGLADAAETGWGSAAFVRQMYPGMAMDEEAVEFLATMQRHACGPATAVGFIQLLNEYDVRDVLPTLRLPVRIVAPTGLPNDWLYRQAEATADLIEGAQFHALPPKALRLWHPSVVRETREFLGIEHPPPELDTLLATVLFSDIVGSTDRQARLGDRAWKELAEQHHSIVRRSLDRWRGVEIDTAGDGFFASFDGPARAIRCALEISQRLADLGIRIRAGVHTGECELINGKIGGITVSIGARVAGMAHPSEVCVSQTVKDLVAGSGLSFEPRGEHELKGVPGRWNLYSAHERS
jgi:class 3 adenylate cyclase/pimeloyl-ACP methyl ester carboxylesterase